jgi:branched-subunit amino acid ABC-type transport system permease component
LVALGFVLIYRATNVVNFAQGDFAMLGAFSMVVLCIDLDFSIGDRGYVLETGRLVAESPAETARFDIGLTLVFVHLLSEPQPAES